MTNSTPLPQFSLEGKVALLTGAGPGIGRATALRLAEDGADIALTARRVEQLETLAREVADQTGRRVIPIPTDVKDLDACSLDGSRINISSI